MRRLIDADALIHKLKTAIELGQKVDESVSELEAVLDDVESMPTIEIEPQWIPCSERLPENMEPVNVTWVNRDPEPYYMHIKDKPFTATGIYFKGKWYWWSSTCEDILCEYGENEIDEVADGIEITAWMQVPEPYEVKETE